MDECLVIRLMNGEELIGKLKSTTTADNIVLADVASVQMMPSQKGLSVGLFPFAPYAETNEFMFDARHIVTYFKPSTDLLNNYNQMYGSGLVVANATDLPSANVVPFKR